MEEQKKIDNWFEEYDKPQTDTEYEQLPVFEMKLAPGKLTRSEEVIFVSEGKKVKTRFGDTIIFTVNNNGVDKTWFIKTTQYSLLNPIARLRKEGILIGKTAIVERVGTGAKDTKWSLNFK